MWVGHMSLLLTATYGQLANALTDVHRRAAATVRGVAALGTQANASLANTPSILGHVAQALLNITSGAHGAGMAIMQLGTAIKDLGIEREKQAKKDASRAQAPAIGSGTAAWLAAAAMGVEAKRRGQQRATEFLGPLAMKVTRVRNPLDEAMEGVRAAQLRERDLLEAIRMAEKGPRMAGKRALRARDAAAKAPEWAAPLYYEHVEAQRETARWLNQAAAAAKIEGRATRPGPAMLRDLEKRSRAAGASVPPMTGHMLTVQVGEKRLAGARRALAMAEATLSGLTGPALTRAQRKQAHIAGQVHAQETLLSGGYAGLGIGAPSLAEAEAAREGLAARRQAQRRSTEAATALASAKRAAAAPPRMAPVPPVIGEDGMGVGAMIGIGAAVVGLGMATKVGADFEHQMARVKSLIQQEYEAKGIKSLERDFKQLGDTAIEMGTKTQFSAIEVSKGMAEFALAGFKQKEILDTIRPATLLATAGNMHLDKATELLAITLRGFRLDASESGRVVDVLAYAANNSVTNLESFGEALRYSMGVTRTAGLSLEETAAAIMLLSDSGLQGCYDPETEVLTSRGWVAWPDVKETDSLACVDPETQEMTYSVPKQLFAYDHDGPMYRVSTLHIDLCVTPNHRMYFRRMNRVEWEVAEAKDIAGKQVDYLATVKWTGDDPETITIPGFLQSRGEWDKAVPDAEVDAVAWARFMGYFLSEGSSCHYGRGNYCVLISQNHGQKRGTMREHLRALPWHVGEDHKGFRIHSQQLYQVVEKLGGVLEKHAPEDLKQLSPRLLREFLEAFRLGDGDDNFTLYTSSKRLSEDLCEIGLKCGYGVRDAVSDRAGDQAWFARDQRFITYTADAHRVHIRTSRLTPRFSPCEYRGKHGQRITGDRNVSGECWVDYRGKVYCAEVPGGLLVVRRNGKVIVCGNSVAGTALRNMLKKTSDTSQEARAMMHAYGLEFSDSKTGKWKGFGVILKEMEHRLRGLGAMKKLEVIGSMLEIRAGTGFLTLLGQHDEYNKRVDDLIKKAPGAAKAMEATQMDTLVGDWRRFKGSIDAVAISIYNLAGPTMRTLVRSFREVGLWLSGTHDNLYEWWGDAGKVLGTKGALGGALTGASLGTVVALLAKILPQTRALMTVGGAMKTGGILGGLWGFTKGVLGLSDKEDEPKVDPFEKTMKRAKQFREELNEGGMSVDVIAIEKLSKSLMELEINIRNTTAATRLSTEMAVRHFQIQSGGFPVILQMAKAFKAQEQGVGDLDDINRQLDQKNAEILPMKNLQGLVKTSEGYEASLMKLKKLSKEGGNPFETQMDMVEDYLKRPGSYLVPGGKDIGRNYAEFHADLPGSGEKVKELTKLRREAIAPFGKPVGAGGADDPGKTWFQINEQIKKARKLREFLGTIGVYRKASEYAPGLATEFSTADWNALELDYTKQYERIMRSQPLVEMLKVKPQLKEGLQHNLKKYELKGIIEGLVGDKKGQGLGDWTDKITQLTAEINSLDEASIKLITFKHRMEEMDEILRAEHGAPALKNMLVQREALRMDVIANMDSFKKLGEARAALSRMERMGQGELGNIDAQSLAVRKAEYLAKDEMAVSVAQNQAKKIAQVFAETRRPEEIFKAQAGGLMSQLQLPKDSVQGIEEAQWHVRKLTQNIREAQAASKGPSPYSLLGGAMVAMNKGTTQGIALKGWNEKLTELQSLLPGTTHKFGDYERAVRKAAKAMDDAMGGVRLPPVLLEGSAAAISRINQYAAENDPNRAVLAVIAEQLTQARITDAEKLKKLEKIEENTRKSRAGASDQFGPSMKDLLGP